jgi:hypothetical protein
MLDQACQLAQSGSNQILALAAVVLIIAGSLFVFLKYGWKKALFLPLIALFVFQAGLFNTLSIANAACTTSSNNPSGGSGVTGYLVNDSSTLIPENGPGGPTGDFSSTFNVLNNDNVPSGDTFVTSSLRLQGTVPKSGFQSGMAYWILDPNNQTPPDPNAPPGPLPSNVWGYWELVLTCDTVNGTTCGLGPSFENFCLDTSSTDCYPTGSVTVFITTNAPAETTITIPYTVNSVSHGNLGTAIISVNTGAHITATDGIEYLTGTCGSEPWDPGWSFNIMTHVSTTGTSPLLISTIDLDPDTPGIQSSVTFGTGLSQTTYSVDGSGVVTLIEPADHPYYGFSYTIQDANGSISNIGNGLIIVANNSCG